MAIALLYWVVAIVSWAYALRHSDKTILAAFVLFIAMTAGTWFATPPEPETWLHINLRLFAADSFYFVGLVVLAFQSRRYWPIWSAGLALMAVLTHFGPLLDQHTNPRVYRGLASVWQLPIFATMILGIAKDRKIIRRGIPSSAKRSSRD